jgi:hypothetical protein
MKSDFKNIPLSRRIFLGFSLTTPFLPVAKSYAKATGDEQSIDDEFVTMLTSEGKAVKVRKEALKKAKVIDKKMSNQSLLSWLKPKGFTK